MMHRAIAFFSAAVGGISVITIVAACSDGDRPPPAATSGPTPSPTTTSTNTPPPSVADGGASFDASLCQTAPLGEPITRLERFGELPFTPLGGAPHAGTFMLTDSWLYTTSPGDAGEATPTERLTDIIQKKTIVVDENAIVIAAAEGKTSSGLGTAVATAGVYTTDGTNLVIKPSCPSSGNDIILGYSATDNGLVLFPPDGTVEVYRELE